MKQIKITVGRDEVMTEIDRQTALTGQKRADADAAAFEHNATQAADRDALATYWDDAFTTLTTACGHYLTRADADADGLTLTLTVPDRHDAAAPAGMTTDARDFMTWAVAARWFAQTDEAAAQLAQQTAGALLDDFRRRLYARQAPTRPTY